MRQPYGPGDIIEIDVIDAEAGVFGPAAPRPHRVRKPRPRWLMPTACGVVAVCGTVALVWRPWENPPDWRTFGPAAPAVSSMSDRLILDLEGLDIISLHEGQNLDADEPTPLGHVFAVPGARYQFDTWALFRSRRSTSAGEARISESSDLVRGLPADVSRVRQRRTVTWGPIDGNYWDAETNGLQNDAALEFANAVGVVAGLPALAYSYDFGDMKPLGDVKTLARVQVLTAYLDGESVLSKFTPTLVTYEVGDRAVTVASINTGTDGLAVARFFLGQGRDVLVHGLPGAVVDTPRTGKVVVWHEGDRLVVVAAEVTDNELVALAEAVRPATAIEWDELVAATAPEATDSGDDITAFSRIVGTGQTANNENWQASTSLGNPTVICVYSLLEGGSSDGSCIYTTPLSPSTHIVMHEGLGGTFVTAVAPTGDQVLRLTSASGDFVDFEPFALNATTEAVAAFLPEGATYELLDPAALK